MHAYSTKTSATLLKEVRDSANAAAWGEFEGRYRAMLLRYICSQGVQYADADDIVQGVFARLLSGLKNFEYDPARGRFRTYLFCCARSALSDWSARPNSRSRAVPEHEAGAVPGRDGADEAFEREWMDHHYRLAITSIRERVEADSIAVLEEMLAGRGVPAIAASLGMSEAAVYKAQQRMRLYLREQIARQVREEDEVHG